MSVVHEIKRDSLLNIGAGLRKLADWADKNPEAVRTMIFHADSRSNPEYRRHPRIRLPTHLHLERHHG